MKISGNRTVGVVGKTGSGKSTIANLLLAFYDTYDGQVQNWLKYLEITFLTWNCSVLIYLELVS